VLVYQIITGEFPYGDRLTRNLNWRTLNKIKYTSAITYNPMIPLWLDGALEKAVNTDQRLRYDTFSEFFFDLTHPNATFMQRSVPLLENNPTLFWKLSSAILLLANIIWLYIFIS
jgi:hypothetical protein